MKRVFLYIDILGFENLVRSNSGKIEYIFNSLNALRVFRNHDLQTVVFSDTILIFNKDNSKPLFYYCGFLVEYAQELFFRLSLINVFFKGVITYGDFYYSQLKNIQAYYGKALIESYHAEKNKALKGFGLYIDKCLTSELVTFRVLNISEDYDYILLCNSIIDLYHRSNGELPIDDEFLMTTMDYSRIEEELRFFREIDYLRKNHTVCKIRKKHDQVYRIYKSILPRYFKKFERNGFLPEVVNASIIGTINPYEILAQIQSEI